MRASRLVSILMLLQSRGRVSARTLAEHLEVSTRTVYRDIDELGAAGVPVIVERGATGGFELMGGWRTTLTGLTPNESQSLFFFGLPGPVAQLGLGDTMASAQLKLLAALPDAHRAEAQRVSSRFHVDLASWYRRAAPAAFLRELADAVWTDRQVAIRYDSWDGVVARKLEPLGLVVKAGDWYLVAVARAGSTPRTYRVSNIRELTLGEPFERPKRFDLAAYWSDATARFQRDIYRATAQVRVSARGRRLLRAASSAVEDAVDRAGPVAEADWLAVEIPIESIGHATQLLLGLGTDVQVLAPRELVEQVARTARAIAASYPQARKRR